MDGLDVYIIIKTSERNVTRLMAECEERVLPRQRQLENQQGEDVFDEVMTADDNEDPPLIQGDAESDEQPPLPGISYQLPTFSMNSIRNLVWKKQSLLYGEEKSNLEAAKNFLQL
ncbi:hypothetical protein K1T71_011676 [Dendrolimus kikuchii]|uniref:Uncharacterized protein n=1 Tax=Dendrolimus kikuchii TaxID=765133 RepID=A0ACC1CM24_9NEOP|nr:hypothetical protein K1T71_011676 [Dendrolimus kikuchii]